MAEHQSMSLARIPPSYIQSTFQSSYSQFSRDRNESLTPLLRDSKDLEYSFHTELENTPYWACSFKWPLVVDYLVVYNRDNPQFYDRIHEIQVIAHGPNGETYTVLSQHAPVFTGRSENNPLVVHFGEKLCTGLTIKSFNRFPLPLHLQQIKIFRKLPLALSSSPNGIQPRYYTCYLNHSGFGDKLLDLATSSYILESLGFRFAGFDPKSLRQACRTTHNIGNAIQMYKDLGFDQLNAEDSYVTNPHRLDLGHSFCGRSLAEIIRIVSENFQASANSPHYSSVQLSISPILCSHLMGQDLSRGFGAALRSEAFKTIGRMISNQLSQGFSDSLNIVIHLRLGDVANLQIDKEKWIIPFDCAWAKDIKPLSSNQLKIHERYDRLPVIQKILELLSSSARRRNMKITLVSDGTSGTRDFIDQNLSILDKQGIAEVLQKAKSSIELIDSSLEHLSNLADYSFIGESSNLFIKVVESVLNADVILSTNGHYCYQLSLLSSKHPFMAMSYMKRTHRDPLTHTLYWSQNDRYDTEYIIKAIESLC